MPLKLIIFDVDGTLVDSSADICRALNHAIKPYGVSEVSVAETVRLVGEGTMALIEKVIREKAPGLDTPTLFKRFAAYYATHLADYSLPYPGAVEVLSALAPFRKAVLSNKIEAFTVQLLETLGLLGYFDHVSGGDTSAEKKPSPVPVLDVLSRFDTLPGEALLVGDSVYDIRAARAAGVPSVAALYGYGLEGFSQGADYTIGSLKELVAIAARLAP